MTCEICGIEMIEHDGVRTLCQKLKVAVGALNYYASESTWGVPFVVGLNEVATKAEYYGSKVAEDALKKIREA